MTTRRLFADERGAELMQAARALVSQLDLEEVLASLLDAALRFTDAQYAAIGVMDRDREQLERFVFRGIDDEAARTIGHLPRGHGVLGTLIRDPRPVRTDDIGRHHDSYGFPPGHPPMRSFLGVPIVLRDTPWGNLYLTEKKGGPFDQADEDAAMLLAEWAAIAIDNARAYELSEERREDLEEAVSALEVSMDIAHAVGAELELDRVLELVVKRGRALVEARTLCISLLDGDEFAIAAIAGERAGLAEGTRHPLADTMSEAVVRTGKPMRFAGSDVRMQSLKRLMRVDDEAGALLVPLMFRGRAVGVLAAIDRIGDKHTYTPEHERLLGAFAASAGTAVAAARSVAEDRIRAVLHAEERERMRWARELHDDTLQHLAALNLELSLVQRRVDDPELKAILQRSIEQATRQVQALRALITDLRPAGLDQLGLGAALRELAARVREANGLEISLDLALEHDRGSAAGRLDADVEAALYRLAQEALTNVVRHAEATAVTMTVHEDAGSVHLEVIDNGKGFDVEQPREGFGVTGMRERAELLGGALHLSSGPKGTALHAEVPVRTRPAAGTSTEKEPLRA